MSAAESVLRHIRQRVATPLTDAALLRSYVESRSEGAFCALVQRHGPMVLRVCRRRLGDAHAAEDAFQATFLTLSRSAKSIRQSDALAGWLFRTAQRIAAKAQAKSRRHATTERRAMTRPRTNESRELTARELLDILDDELAKLPDRDRLPLLLVYWQNRSYAQAARELKLTLGALHGRLERGRERLAERLRSRGVTPGDLGAVLAATLASAALPSDLLATTAALAAPGAIVPAAVVALSAGSGAAKLLSAAIAVLVVGVGTIGIAGGWAEPQKSEAKKNPPVAHATGSPSAAEPRVDRFGDPLPRGAIMRVGSMRFKHPNSAMDLVLSPDGKFIATLGSGMVRIWDSANGKLVHNFTAAAIAGIEGFLAGQRRLAFASDGRLYVATPGKLVVCDPAIGLRPPVVLDESSPIHSVDLSSDSQLVAMGTDSEIIVKRLATEQVLARFPNSDTIPRGPGHRDRLLFHGAYCCAVFSPGRNELAVHTSDEPKLVRLCDALTGAERRTIELGERLIRMAFSRDGKRIAVTERDNALRIYETESGRRTQSWTIKLDNPVENYTSVVAFSPDGKRVAVGATDHAIHIWDVETAAKLHTLTGHRWNISGLAFSPDGGLLYSTSWDGTVRRWDTVSGREQTLGEQAAGNGIAALSPDGTTIAAEGSSGALNLWDRAGMKLGRTLLGNPAGFSRILFGPTGKVIATASNDQSIQIWDATTGTITREWNWKEQSVQGRISDLAFSPDGSKLAIAMFPFGGVLLLDVATGERVATFSHLDARSIAFSPNGSLLVSVGWDAQLRYWDLSGREKVVEFILPNVEMNAFGMPGDNRGETVAWSPDGKIIAVLHLDGVVSVWDAVRRRVLARYVTPGRGQGRLLAFSPDGLWLATLDSNNAVCLREPLSGQIVFQAQGHSGKVIRLQFGPDGKTLLSGSKDNTALLWSLRPQTSGDRALAALWDDLSGTDATQTYKAIWSLADRPAESVDLIKSKTTPVPAIEPSRVNRWIAELSSDKFAVRETANKELANVADRIEIPLKEALNKTTSAEQKKRIQEILDRSEPTQSVQARVQACAIAILEHIATPAARDLLAELAKGAPGARLTVEANASLARLKAR